jgi:MoaE-MoaD fusion protein
VQPVIEITYDAIDLNQILNRITSKTTGAACIFTGMVRGRTRRNLPHDTAYLEYEAYIPMAQGKMQQIADEIIARWPEVEGIVLVQRIGKLEPGAPSVVVACSASHRDEGIFEAARYGIDRLKEIVPVWKKEVSPEGEYWVEGDYLPTRED